MVKKSNKSNGFAELQVTKPISFWNRNLTVKPKELFKQLGKMALKGASLDFAGVGETALDALDAAGLKKDPKEIAWLLIFRSLMAAVAKLIYDHRDLFENSPGEENLDRLSSLIADEFERVEVTVGLEFFKKPAEQPFLQSLTVLLADWLKSLGLSITNANVICGRLPDNFTVALHEKWRSAPDDYVELKQFFDTPFTQATEEVRGWQLYNQWLKDQVNNRMFAEPFGVERVYVPLRAYYEEKPDIVDKDCIDREQTSWPRKIVFDLEKDFRDWLEDFSIETAVRFISGGPGSGKSTFAKIFASRIANGTEIPTLYIPLHLFDATGDLVAAMGRFIEGNRFLTGNPLDAKNGKKRLFIIFDGLDELAMQGKAASEVATGFVDEVLRRIHQGNVQGLQRQVLITGRSIAIQSVAGKLREKKQISYVLPYLVKNDKERFGRKEYEDPEKLLAQDQRDQWWVLYGCATGKKYNKLPDLLCRESLEEITAQPLLNYLVALSYDKGRVAFTDDTTLNQVYEDLIHEVYSRQYEGCKHACVGCLSEEQFVRVLEEIALAVWHGDGRAATVASIQEKCRSGNVQGHLESFQDGAKDGVTRLLTAFYFRQSESRKDGDPTFEFTHKSFGEYLCALRVFRGLKKIQTLRTNMLQGDPDYGWSEKDALEHWVELCAPTAMDQDLIRFVANEFFQMHNRLDSLLELQDIIAELLSFIINRGLPFPASFSGKGFKELLSLARNAEEALLGIHHRIAAITGKVSSFEVETSTALGEWIARLRGQRHGPANKLALNSLGYLNFSYNSLDIQDFYGANLQMTNLSGARLFFSIFDEANLSGANFTKTSLVWTSFRRANLEQAILEKADLCFANLILANLKGANLRGADLSDAKLTKTVLMGANLEEAKLERADFTNADLSDANLARANLSGANLKGANLTGVDLTGAKLDKTRGLRRN